MLTFSMNDYEVEGETNFEDLTTEEVTAMEVILEELAEAKESFYEQTQSCLMLEMWED